MLIGVTGAGLLEGNNFIRIYLFLNEIDNANYNDEN
jgi:hypothetical protein